MLMGSNAHGYKFTRFKCAWLLFTRFKGKRTLKCASFFVGEERRPLWSREKEVHGFVLLDLTLR
jgi:hypothetical protein